MSWTATDASYRSLPAASSPSCVGRPTTLGPSCPASIFCARRYQGNAIRLYPGSHLGVRVCCGCPAGLTKVERVLQLIDGVEELRIDPADAAPEYWHHVHNRLSVNETPRPYTSSRHQAWLHRRRVTS